MFTQNKFCQTHPISPSNNWSSSTLDFKYSQARYSIVVIGFESFQSQCIWAFEQTLCAPHADTK